MFELSQIISVSYQHNASARCPQGFEPRIGRDEAFARVSAFAERRQFSAVADQLLARAGIERQRLHEMMVRSEDTAIGAVWCDDPGKIPIGKHRCGVGSPGTELEFAL